MCAPPAPLPPSQNLAIPLQESLPQGKRDKTIERESEGRTSRTRDTKGWQAERKIVPRNYLELLLGLRQRVQQQPVLVLPLIAHCRHVPSSRCEGKHKKCMHRGGVGGVELAWLLSSTGSLATDHETLWRRSTGRAARTATLSSVEVDRIASIYAPFCRLAHREDDRSAQCREPRRRCT